MFYLAYGMNTNIEGMSQRCPAAVSCGKVMLKDHVLRFKYHADAEYSPGDEMECAIWIITDKCEAGLDALEGYPDYYNKKFVQVEHNGKTVDAMIYYMNHELKLMTPAQSYFNSVLKGYEQHNMDPIKLYQAQIDTLDSV